MSMEEPRPEGLADVTGEVANEAGIDSAAGIRGAPRKVQVLAFEPDQERPGEWRARQFALNRFSPERSVASIPPLPSVAAPMRKASPRETHSALPIRLLPRRREDYTTSIALDEIAVLQEIVTEVRRIRGEMEISPKVPLTLLIASDDLRIRLSPHARALVELCNGTVQALAGERPAGVAACVVRGEEVVIPLDGVVDLAAEKARLQKVIAKVDKDVSQLEGRLSNTAFVQNAKPEVVEDLRVKLEAAQVRRATLGASLARLGA